MQRVIVTGANRGLGFATAEKLLRRGCAVVMTSRDLAMGEAAADKLRAAVPGAEVEARQLDTAKRASIEAFVGALLAEDAAVDVLVNNAGRMNRDPNPVIDTALVPGGIELFFASNVLGPFLLTRMLLPLVLRAPAPRVVNVSSRTHLRLPKGSFSFDDVDSRRDFDPRVAYARSKLAVTWLTYELARRLAGVTVNCVCPGFVPKTAGTNVHGLLRFVTLHVMPLMPFAHTVDEATDAFVTAALDPKLAGVSGKFFGEQHEIASSDDSYDETQARRMWSLACGLLGIAEDPHEPPVPVAKANA